MYYRLLTADGQVFELYRDAAAGDVWVLDVVQDCVRWHRAPRRPRP
jgi:hypothetical protein